MKITAEERAARRLATLLHGEFCKSETCDGLNDYIDAARRLLPKIDASVATLEAGTANKLARALSDKEDRCVDHLREALGYEPDATDAGLEALTVAAKAKLLKEKA